ncbi:hypothetical protein L917_10416 [Phytophthora nicotianae]|uniref:Uncharacterized protein n=1 Tax=Phytophthora nicotianae TaxID=4792 RepID=W2L2Z3_PHYNI|nr:hypothetical protein L917_10416 [Phytophthora nicotianae]
MAFHARLRELMHEGWKSQQSTELSYGSLLFHSENPESNAGAFDVVSDELLEQQRLRQGSSGESRSSAAAREHSEQGNTNSDGNHSLPNDSERSSNEVLDRNAPQRKNMARIHVEQYRYQ